MISAAPGERRTRPVASATPPEPEDSWLEDAWAEVGGVLGCRSTLIEFVPAWIVLCSSPATTSTSSGGSTARLVTTGAKAGAGLGEEAPGGGVCGFALARAAAAGCGVLVVAADGVSASVGVCSTGSNPDSTAGAGGNQNSRSFTKTRISASRSSPRAISICLRCFCWESSPNAGLSSGRSFSSSDVMTQGLRPAGRQAYAISMPRNFARSQRNRHSWHSIPFACRSLAKNKNDRLATEAAGRLTQLL